MPQASEIKPMADLIPQKDGPSERLPDEGVPIGIGEWYWIKNVYEEKDFFGCVVHVGSNFAEIENPHGKSVRIHFDKFDKLCRKELDPEKLIQGKIDHYKGVVREKLGEIKELTARLGLTPSHKIVEESASRSLSVISGVDNVKNYKQELIRAKETDLPKLFEEVKEGHENLAIWMQATALPMKAAAEGMEECVEAVNDRVFSISLYAGLTEEVIQITKGDPAGISEKLRIMQRLLYMDEECLLNYKHGGMEFKDIGQFDTWLAKPENRDRVMPFPRGIVAFRVRRQRKERGWDGSLRNIWINIGLEESDKTTFLYIRNGERMYRMNCELEFGELIFPGREEMDLSEPMMAKMFCSKVEDVITKRHYDDMVKERKEEEKKYNAWKKANPKMDSYKNPHYHYRDIRVDSYHSFNKSSVYYDEISGEIERRVKHYNRIAVIVQGLYDRSEVLHPHPPVKLWNPEGFSSAIDLVYDGSNTLHYGNAPDFEAYRKACNSSLKEGSITIGQDDFWQLKEGKKESTRLDNDWRNKSEHRPDRFKPYGNPGPGYLARIVRWKPGSRKATFEWTRARLKDTYSEFRGERLPCAINVPDSRLFNVDAYKLGDFKQFFQDPRTRAEYLQWAPMLIAAEEYHAGNKKVKVGPKEED